MPALLVCVIPAYCVAAWVAPPFALTCCVIVAWFAPVVFVW